MDQISLLLSIIIPSGLVMFGMYLAIKTMLAKELEKKIIQLKAQSVETVLPSRLQAYERMVLFLERISPNNLVIRTMDHESNAAMYQQRLLHEVREEFSHNFSQQIYMSDEAWFMVKAGMQAVNNLINETGEAVPGNASAMDFANKMVEKLAAVGDPTAEALSFVKKEIRQNF